MPPCGRLRAGCLSCLVLDPRDRSAPAIAGLLSVSRACRFRLGETPDIHPQISDQGLRPDTLSAWRPRLHGVAYDEQLAEHIRDIAREPGLNEKRMFGGQAFLIHRNLALSASGQGGLLLRVDPVQTETLIADPNATRAVMRGREMNEWLRIYTDALTDAELEQWINRGR
jgi:TfoX N-terminal domain